MSETVVTLLATRPTRRRRRRRRGKHRLHEPGGRGGLVEVFRSRTVVQMLVRRDLRVKYRTSSIGYLWEFVQPTIHFCVYYFIIGIVLGHRAAGRELRGLRVLRPVL